MAGTYPPKFSLANGYATGSIPRRISYKTKDGKVITVEITEEDLTDLLRLISCTCETIWMHTGTHRRKTQVNHGALSVF